MSDSGITAEQYDSWLTPRAALYRVQEALPDIGVASRAIQAYLDGGQLLAAARSSTFERETPVLIPVSRWCILSMPNADWWDTGTVRVFVRGRTHSQSSYPITYYGVRFDPKGI